MTKKQKLNLTLLVLSALLLVFFVYFANSFVNTSSKTSAKIISSPYQGRGFLSGLVVEYYNVSFVDNLNISRSGKVSNYFRNEILTNQTEILYSEFDSDLVFFNNWVDIFGVGFFIAFLTTTILILFVISVLFKSDLPEPLQGVIYASFLTIVALSIFQGLPRLKHIINDYGHNQNTEYKEFSINEYTLKIPTSWESVETDLGYKFFENNIEVALLSCPMPEAGFEAWGFQTKSRLIGSGEDLHGIDIWFGTPKDIENDSPLTLIFMHRNEFDSWYDNEDYEFSCYITSNNISSDIANVLYSSIIPHNEF